MNDAWKIASTDRGLVPTTLLVRGICLCLHHLWSKLKNFKNVFIFQSCLLKDMVRWRLIFFGISSQIGFPNETLNHSCVAWAISRLKIVHSYNLLNGERERREKHFYINFAWLEVIYSKAHSEIDFRFQSKFEKNFIKITKN